MPEIAIDSNYLDKLKETKLSPSDKAEKIIRDIETVIRRNEANSAVYVEFQNRLDDLIKRKKEKSEAIEQTLIKLGELYGELDEIASLPQRMGFADKGSFEVFTIVKNFSGDDFDEALTKDFAQSVCDDIIKKKIYIGWQDVPNEAKRISAEIKLFSADDKYLELGIYDNDELLDSVMKSILQNYKLD